MKLVTAKGHAYHLIQKVENKYDLDLGNWVGPLGLAGMTAWVSFVPHDHHRRLQQHPACGNAPLLTQRASLPPELILRHRQARSGQDDLGQCGVQRRGRARGPARQEGGHARHWQRQLRRQVPLRRRDPGRGRLLQLSDRGVMRRRAQTARTRGPGRRVRERRRRALRGGDRESQGFRKDRSLWDGE